MKIIITAIILITLASFATAQIGADSGSSDAPNAVMAASDHLRITSPTIGERIPGSQITARYEITDPAADAAPSPTFSIQLDGRDPSETLDNSYTFNGLAPGAHSIIVQLVDANHNPLSGSQAIVHFKTYTPGAAAPQSSLGVVPPAVVKAKLPLPSKAELPNAGSELPLLSLVGFGVLFGGAISAIRGRK
ncbi:MAG TPA: hypothetical protein VMU28_09125 [Terriglobales bacterium]|nr:hypothetical protein [Terriglobales bacterium]